MFIGEVIGNVWVIKKYDGLDGLKFLIVKIEDNKRMVVFDLVGVGIGEKVIIFIGSLVRNVFNMRDVFVDVVIIGIIDGMDEE